MLGLHLTGGPDDLAQLHHLLFERPALRAAEWVALAPLKTGTVIASPALTHELIGEAFKPIKIHNGHIAELSTPYTLTRSARHLLEAIPPHPIEGDPIVAQACFIARQDSKDARSLLTRLLRMNRDDAMVTLWQYQNESFIAYIIDNPPLYLLMHCRDESSGTTAYARYESSSLWVEWGHMHPFPGVCAAQLAATQQTALVAADGSWLITESEWSTRPIHDVVAADLDAQTIDLHPNAGEIRFVVRLSLCPTRWRPPTLWVLTPDKFMQLGDFIEATPTKELSPLTVARVADLNGTVRYLLRERRTKGKAAIGERIGDIVDVSGHGTVPGTENLYIPVGLQLSPALRPDELRRVTGIDKAALVILEPDLGGLQLTQITKVNEVPLAQWIDYVVADHRLVLDALIEQSVFVVDSLLIDRPRVHKVQTAAKAPTIKKTQRKRSQPKSRYQISASVDESDARRAARSIASELEPIIIEGGCTDPKTWYNLAEALTVLEATDDAAICWANARFYATDRDSINTQWVTSIRPLVESGTADALIEMVTRTPAHTVELVYAIARFVADSDDPAVIDLGQLLGDLAVIPTSPLPVRTAWQLLMALHGHNADRLGLTRAKEALFGGMNVNGLRDTYEAPRFVRYALALSEDRDNSGGQGELLTILERCWQQVEPVIEELDPQSLFYRMIFASGFIRLGAPGRARPLLDAIEYELDVHDAPVRALIRLYQDHLARQQDDRNADWATTVSNTLRPLGPAKSLANTLIKRSRWLQVDRPTLPDCPLNSRLEIQVSQGEHDPDQAPGLLTKLLEQSDAFEVEMTKAFERLSIAVMGTGREPLIESVLNQGIEYLNTLTSPTSIATTIAIALNTAAVIGHETAIDNLLNKLILLMRKTDRISPIMVAIRPAITALHRVGAGQACLPFLEELSLIGDTQDGSAVVTAFAADGYRLIGDLERSDKMVDLLFRQLVKLPDHVARFQGACALTELLSGWPPNDRERYGQALLEILPRFRDAFPSRKYFAVHQVLVIEQLVDAIVDRERFASSQVNGWLALEEQAIRRRIVTDWRQMCG